MKKFTDRRIFLYLLLIILSVNSQDLSSQQYSLRSEADFKSYFQKNKNSIDLIEGIYQLHWNTEAINVNRQTGNRFNDDLDVDFKCIVYKKNDTQYNVYIYEKPDLPKIEAPENYKILKTASPTKFLFTFGSSNYNSRNMELYFVDNATLKSQKKYKDDGGGTVYADITLNYTFTKIYPATSDYQTASESTQKSTGTGFAVSTNGYIVTNYHVIDNANSIKVRGVNNDFSTSYAAKVIVSDKNNDLAIIQITDTKFSGISTLPYLIRNSTVDVGEDVFVLGYPLTASMGDEIKLTTGIISARSGFQGDITTYQMTAPIQPGNSGAPVFDKNGLLIAVTNAKHLQAENAGYAIKTNYLKNLIESLPTNVTFQTTNQLQSKPLTEQVKVLKKFVYIIEIN